MRVPHPAAAGPRRANADRDRAGPGPATVRARHWWLLALLTALVAGLRLPALDYGLPHLVDQDNVIHYQVEHLRDGKWNRQIERDYPCYPLLTAYTTLLFSRPMAVPAGGSLDEHRRAASEISLSVRKTVAVFSIFAVPLTFLVALYFMGPGWALFASALVASSLLSQFLAQQARAHSVHACFGLLSVWATLRVLQRPTWGRTLAAGAAFFLALASLQNALAAGIPLVAAFWIARGRQGAGAGRWLRPLVALAMGAVAIPVFYPFLTQPGAVETGDGSFRLATHELSTSLVDFSGWKPVVWALWNYEPVLSALVLVALGQWVWARFRGAAGAKLSEPAQVMLWYALPYLAVLVAFGRTFDRFVVPLVPPLAVCAAWGLARSAASARWGRRGSVLVCGLLLLVPACATARMALLRARPDTLTEAAVWLEERLEAELETKVFLSPRPNWRYCESSVELPLARREEGLKGPGGLRGDDYNVWSRYQRRLPVDQRPTPAYDVAWMYWFDRDVPDYEPPRQAFLEAHPGAYFASTGPGYYVIEPYDERDAEDIQGLRRALQQYGRLEVRFSPDGDPALTTLPLLYRDGLEHQPHLTLRVLRARAWGPNVEIYRVTSEALRDVR